MGPNKYFKIIINELLNNKDFLFFKIIINSLKSIFLICHKNLTIDYIHMIDYIVTFEIIYF